MLSEGMQLTSAMQGSIHASTGHLVAVLGLDQKVRQHEHHFHGNIDEIEYEQWLLTLSLWVSLVGLLQVFILELVGQVQKQQAWKGNPKWNHSTSLWESALKHIQLTFVTGTPTVHSQTI